VIRNTEDWPSTWHNKVRSSPELLFNVRALPIEDIRLPVWVGDVAPCGSKICLLIYLSIEMHQDTLLMGKWAITDVWLDYEAPPYSTSL